MTNEQLIQKAKQAKEYSHSPYSKFRVGAALVCKSGNVYTGCNIENSAYGPSVCAERTAIFKAISEGERQFEKLAIITDSQNFEYPCGVCRQVISEFAPDLQIIVANQSGDYKQTTLKKLLPNAFKL